MPRSPTAPLTQRDLARRLGVSQVTVHRALSGRGGISEELRERIQQQAHANGYRLNASARAARQGSFNCYSLVLNHAPARSALPPALMHGIQHAMLDADRHLILATLGDDKLTSEGFVPKILRECMADGLLINYNARIPPAMVELIRRYRIPSIWLNSKQSGDCVYFHDTHAAEEGTRRLLEAGHRRVCYVDFSRPADPASAPWHYSSPDRYEGYARAMLACGATTQTCGADRLVGEGRALGVLEELLSGAQRPTAVMCYSMREANFTMYAAARIGLRVPRDLSVVAIGPQSGQGALGQLVSTLALPEEQAGRRAVELLTQKVAAPDRVLDPLVLQANWVEGQTIAMPPVEASGGSRSGSSPRSSTRP